jgi:copper chaperone CopZ
MKKWLLTAALIAYSNVVMAAGVVVSVPEAHCQMCADAIKTSFGKNEAVKQVSLDTDKRELTIEFNDGKSLDDETIAKTVKDAGFDSGKITRM